MSALVQYAPTGDDMRSAGWPPFDLIFFDCDSTLSAIEGIDELARV